MLEVGQTLYVYSTDSRHKYRAPIEVTVSKVGRKWATTDGGRKVSLENLFVDAGQYSAFERCYESVEERANELALQDAWNEFRRCVDRQWPSPTTNIENIRQAAALMGFSIPSHDGKAAT